MFFVYNYLIYFILLEIFFNYTEKNIACNYFYL